MAWVIPVLAVVTVSLGTWGWLDHGQDFADSLYRSGALFAYNDVYGGGAGSADWRFRTARWAGLVVVFSTALVALGALLQSQLALGVARRLRQEVVVIGGDGVATAGFEAARAAGFSVLWLGAPALSVSTARAIALPWPPEEPTTTVLEHAVDASHILVSLDDDALAMALARAARAAAPRALITLMMRDVRLAEDAAATLNEAHTRVLSRAAISARTLNLEHPPFLVARDLGHARIHALIVGFGHTGHAIARDLIVNCRTTYLQPPRITVIDPQAKALEGVFRVRAPEADASAEFVFIEGQVSSVAISPDPIAVARTVAVAGPITTAYVCLASDSEALAAAGMLQSLTRAIDIGQPAIFVRLRDSATVAGRSGGARGLDALIPFGDLDTILEASEFLSARPDAAARAFNEAYRRSLAPEVREDPANRSAYAWDDLDETFRQANRDVVAHVPAKLASAGIDPALWRGVRGLPVLKTGALYADGAELEALSELEHERWSAQRRMDGWRRTERPAKDEARRLHPSLVPYDQLTDPIKEFDRGNVRETRRACWPQSDG
ncbi:RyR domain-containing protein [Phenylobacterium sp.]|jgi:hypothetical protein|uniref:RyR domain-containing protein n=1 Tax=Phenylobacterium sp. TaxID=1871053 RepID=UPI002F412770